MKRLALITVVLAAVVAVVPAVQAADPESVAAAFTADLSFGEEAPLLGFSGDLLLAGERMRAEFTHELTGEATIVLLDYDTGAFVLLYPDTLNGQRHDLAAFDEIDGFRRVREALTGAQPEMPSGWKQQVLEPDELDGLLCAHFSAESGDGVRVEWWTRSDGRPLRAIATVGDASLDVRLRDYTLNPDVDPSAFEIPEGYTIADAGDDTPAALPELDRTI